MSEPVWLKPYFRCDSETPWGGNALAALFGKEIPSDVTGESLEVSALPGRESVADGGEYDGKNLAEIWQMWGGEGEFPLLLKLLDAREMLSVQVHPGDEYARAKEGKFGKTEAWLILYCEPGAKLVYGLNKPDFDDVENALRWVTVKPGDVLYIPHGCVHAIGAGIVLYEIQQPSDVTYRVWDWGRGRQLHMEQAKDVSRFDLPLQPSQGATAMCKGGSVTYYISCSHFELSRLNVHGDMPLDGRMRLITGMSPLTVKWADGERTLMPGQTCLVPADAEGVYLSGRGAAICSSLPDRAALEEALGERAKLVTGDM